VRTHCEPGENEKQSFPPQTEKEKNQGTLHACWPSHWLHEISLPKEFVTTFGLG
jgi:hypothetical protein